MRTSGSCRSPTANLSDSNFARELAAFCLPHCVVDAGDLLVVELVFVTFASERQERLRSSILFVLRQCPHCIKRLFQHFRHAAEYTTRGALYCNQSGLLSLALRSQGTQASS